MADLAACYFCGAALDDALQTVRLGDGPSLTLCRSCREKLERVLDAVDAGSDTAPTETAAVDQGTDSPTTVDGPQEPAGEDSSTDSLPDEPGSTDPTDAETGSPAAEATADSPQDATTDEDRAVVAGDQDVSALEYNKVMRMLQNRDFPVDRDEFVAVAANAYQVSYTDCDRVIDAAIDQGLLDEADGRLIRPE